ncbi:MAG TPA: STAS/SEC14 domain-containing protein [Pirellulales bacterium]|nr:STAS/SEC14 domain-containing protein [Pirellulales bacterium]
MSVEVCEIKEDKAIEVDLSDKLTKEDYGHFLPAVEAAIQRHGKIRMLVVMRDFHGWTAGALWEDIKFDFRHFRDIERLALVGQNRWEAGMAVFCKPFTTAKIKYFDLTAIEEAKQWIGDGLKASVTH